MVIALNAIVAYLLSGVALKLLWGWFMVPTLGLPVISLVQAIGVGIVISFLTQQHIPRDKDEAKELLIYEVIKPVLAIAVGWVVHLFM
ncbi:MAG: hypothetical protein HYW89_01360 [Candidatus Sungiibacteriota bacterium]|uniref:Uncharacterized protein n=1 Tax=Candidatus Sungiibacteriota bacterium TaxID=2750080 RepID=A0A7T5RK07_9BACT|nr:MAG: hypothetical protein HYW89_01360 [Candidatus Sungbacteria bacterium]